MIIFMSRSFYNEVEKNIFDNIKEFEFKLNVYLSMEFDRGCEEFNSVKNEIMNFIKSSKEEQENFSISLTPSTDLEIIIKNENQEEKLLKMLALIRGKTTGEIFECTEEEYCRDFDASKEEFEKLGPAYWTTKMFKSGCCGNIASLIKLMFPDSEILYCRSEGHLMAKLNDKLFDITGDITEEFKDKKLNIPEPVDIEDMTDNYDAFNNRPIL